MAILQHLRERHVDLELHCPIIDESEGIATFLLFNLSGQIVGFQQYRPSASKEVKNNPRDGRYFTFRKSPTVAVFGVESLHLTPEIVFVTEGIFDAVRLTKRRVSALAVLSNDPTSDVRNFLACLSRKTVAVCDNDTAGKKLASSCDEAIFTSNKDLGDSDEEFVDDLLRRYKLLASN